MTTTPGVPPAPPSSHPPVPRRLARLTDQSKMAGVAAGIGWYLNVDPTLIRIGFVVLGLATGGAAIGLYLLLWLVMPASTSATTGLRSPQQTDSRSRGLTIAAIVFGVLLFSQIDLFRGDVLVASGLIGVGVLLFIDTRQSEGRHASDARQPPPPPRPGQAPTVPPDLPTQQQTSAVPDAQLHPSRASAYGDPYAAGWPSPAPPVAPVRQPRQRRTRSLLGPLTWAAWLLVMGVAALLDRAGVVTLGAGDVVGLTVAVAGVGLVVGTLYGRSRGLIWIGLFGLAGLAVGGWVSGAAPGFNLTGGVGERVHTPLVVSELQDGYDLAAGQMVLDLSTLDLDGQDVDLDVSVGLGELRVVLPSGVPVDVDGRLRAGEYSILGLTDEGAGLSFDVGREQGAEAAPDPGSIALHIDNALGQITVTQEGPR